MGVVLAFALSLHAPPKLSVAPDKVKHFFLAAFVESVSYSTVRAAGVQHDRALVAASAVTLSASIGKEVWDSRRGGRFSIGDVVWDVAGGAAAAAMLEESRR
jgi:uncharacterized protein YfiM (DUF2279 family)